MKSNYINEYHQILANDLPLEINKYLAVPEIKRLEKIGYFCGMDYCSKAIYDMKFYYSTLDHSLSTARIVWNYTKNLTPTIATLVHDISSPVFRHVIDFMNGDSLYQESTEEYTEKIIRKSEELNKCLEEDQINVDDIIDYKQYPIADNKRPKLSADRLEGVFASNLIWTKSLELADIKTMYDDIIIVKNEDNVDEMAFKNLKTASAFLKESIILNKALSQNEDKFCMLLLSKITKLLVLNKVIKNNELYIKDESELIDIITNSNINEVKQLWETFTTIPSVKRSESSFEIPSDVITFDMNKLEFKERHINPLVVVNGCPIRLLSVCEESQINMNEAKNYKDSRYAYVKRI